MDFEQLVSGSEKLLSHIARPDGIPRLDKSLGEIEQGSLRMGAEATTRSRREALSLGVTPEVAGQKQELKGGSMLARNRFDPEALNRMVKAVQLRGEYQPLQPLGETDIEGYLAHHHDMIVLSTVEETRRAAEEWSLARQREWEVDSWRQTKKAFMDQVLDPSGGNGGFLMGPGGAGSAGVSPSAATDNSKLRPANLKQSAPAPPPAGSIIPPLTVSAVTTRIASRLTALEADHAAVIHDLHEKVGGSKYPLATKLSSAAKKVVLPGTNSGLQFAYSLAWDILRQVSMLEGDDWERRTAADTSRFRVEGTLDFLQTQFRNMLESKVKKARDAGTLDASSLRDTATGLLPKIRAYMRLLGIHEASNQTGPVYSGLQAWPQIYLCMRCGKRDEAADIALGASEALENRNSRGQDLELLKVVSKELMADGITRGSESILRQIFESLVESDDVYKRAVLNIIARANSKKVTRIHKEIIEDYMWFKLLFIEGDPEESGVLLAAQERVGGRAGRKNFDPDGNNPFAYVNVLLYTQQLGAVVAYLHWKGCHIAALHMAIAMHHHKAYPDANSDGSMANLSNYPYPNDGSEPGPPPPLQELMERSLQGRFESDPEVCAEYLLLLPTSVAYDCLSSLAAHIGAAASCRLLGFLKTDSGRHEGMLDKFLEGRVVEEIAFSAGVKSEGQGKRADAITFYGLSCMWTKMTTLLGRELAERLMPNAENRPFWKEVGTKMHDMLDKNVLKEESHVNQARSDLVQSVSHVLHLMDFFDILQNEKMAAGRLLRASIELEHAGLIPTSQIEASQLAERIRARDPQDGFRAVLQPALETGMQCLRHYYHEVKKELLGPRPENINVQAWRASRERVLSDVEGKGHAMLALAGRLLDVLPASFVADLSRVHASILS
ncbi:unnamed protein product [Ascophyllum nodosum]